MAKKPTLESIDVSLARWKTRLKRAVTAIDKLEKQRKRLLAKQSIPASTLVAAVKGHIARATSAPTPPPAVEPTAPAPMPTDDLGIPSFLKRMPDPVAEQIKAEQAETKRLKARGRIEKLKAKKSGELKKMPLSGKAALDHIRNG